jgi:hypothetical protein
MRPHATILGARVFGALIALSSVGAASCRRGEPPAPNDVIGAVAPLPPAASGAAPNAGEGTSDAGADATTSETRGTDGGTDPGALEQTRDKPRSDTAAFQARAAALFRGIVDDDPKAAMPFFFPVTAYAQVKAVANPRGDWKHRLVAAYERDIHALHEHLGSKAADAKLLRVDVPERAKWVEPDEEYNRIGYYRVYATRLVYTTGQSGREHTIEISSLISWRGEWYVVHLTGFK